MILIMREKAVQNSSGGLLFSCGHYPCFTVTERGSDSEIWGYGQGGCICVFNSAAIKSSCPIVNVHELLKLASLS